MYDIRIGQHLAVCVCVCVCVCVYVCVWAGEWVNINMYMCVSLCLILWCGGSLLLIIVMRVNCYMNTLHM